MFNDPLAVALSDVVTEGHVSHPPSFELALAQTHLTSMDAAQSNELLKQLRSAGRYLEWGSGGSTLLASWLMLLRNRSGYASESNLTHAVSIESSTAFVDRLIRKHAPIKQALSSGALVYHLANVGITKAWGYPQTWADTPSERERWYTAYVAPLPHTACCFDAILIDGRFRAACALHALRLSHPSTHVMIHDNGMNNSHRGYNRTLHKWYRFERQVGALSLMRPKPRMLAMAKDRSKEGRAAYAQAIDAAMHMVTR